MVTVTPEVSATPAASVAVALVDSAPAAPTVLAVGVAPGRQGLVGQLQPRQRRQPRRRPGFVPEARAWAMAWVAAARSPAATASGRAGRVTVCSARDITAPWGSMHSATMPSGAMLTARARPTVLSQGVVGADAAAAAASGGALASVGHQAGRDQTAHALARRGLGDASRRGQLGPGQPGAAASARAARARR